MKKMIEREELVIYKNVFKLIDIVDKRLNFTRNIKNII